MESFEPIGVEVSDEEFYSLPREIDWRGGQLPTFGLSTQQATLEYIRTGMPLVTQNRRSHCIRAGRPIRCVASTSHTEKNGKAIVLVKWMFAYDDTIEDGPVRVNDFYGDELISCWLPQWTLAEFPLLRMISLA